MAMGWMRVFNQRGVTITGSFSTRSRMISNDELPDPTTIPALRVVTGMFPERRIASTFCRD
jgi:hypothetical protein